jgi:hypothetical protein
MTPEVGFTLTTLNIQTESTSSPRPSDDGTVRARDFTSMAISDTESGEEHTFTPLLDATTASVLRAQDNGATTPAEVTSTVVVGEAHEEPASTVPHEITEQTTQTAALPKGPTETSVPTEQSTENVAPRGTGTVSPMGQTTDTIAPTEQPAATVTATEQVSGRVTLIEQPTQTASQTGQMAPTVEPVEPVEIFVPTEQPAETVVPTKQPTDILAQTEQPAETARPGDELGQTKEPTEMVVQTETMEQTEPEDKMTQTEEQTETAVPTEPAGAVTQAQQTETVASIEQRTETMTTNTVADIVNNTIPDDATVQVSSTEIDSGSSIVTNDEALIQSMGRYREVRRTLGTSVPLAYNFSSPATSENTTTEPSKRTRRSIEGKVLLFACVALLRFILLRGPNFVVLTGRGS